MFYLGFFEQDENIEMYYPAAPLQLSEEHRDILLLLLGDIILQGHSDNTEKVYSCIKLVGLYYLYGFYAQALNCYKIHNENR